MGELSLYRKLVSRIYPDVPRADKLAADFASTLQVGDADLAAEVLAEAQELFRVPFARADSAERRAATLQGAVAIAATFTLAAGSLVGGTDKVDSHPWRIVFAVSIAVVVLAFVVAGVVALQATSRLSTWRYPDDLTRFVDLTTLSVAHARIARAVALLTAHGQNANLASWKIERTSLAAGWFRAALLLLLLFAVLFVFYVAWS